MVVVTSSKSPIQTNSAYVVRLNIDVVHDACISNSDTHKYMPDGVIFFPINVPGN